MATKKPLPYWLDGGTEVCEHCVVVIRDTGEVLCHECAEEEKP